MFHSQNIHFFQLPGLCQKIIFNPFLASFHDKRERKQIYSISSTSGSSKEQESSPRHTKGVYSPLDLQSYRNISTVHFIHIPGSYIRGIKSPFPHPKVLSMPHVSSCPPKAENAIVHQLKCLLSSPTIQPRPPGPVVWGFCFVFSVWFLFSLFSTTSKISDSNKKPSYSSGQ